MAGGLGQVPALKKRKSHCCPKNSKGNGLYNNLLRSLPLLQFRFLLLTWCPRTGNIGFGTTDKVSCQTERLDRQSFRQSGRTPCLLELISMLPADQLSHVCYFPSQRQAVSSHLGIAAEVHLRTVFVRWLMIAMRPVVCLFIDSPGPIVSLA